MTINFQKVTINLIYNNKVIPVFTDTLEEIDKFTGSELTKLSLLKKIVNSNKTDKLSIDILKNINDDFCDTYLLDDEIESFEFVLSARCKEQDTDVALPILYDEFSYKSIDILNQLKANDNLCSILGTYSKYVETDDRNKMTSTEIITDLQKINKNDIDLSIYENLEERKNNNEYLNTHDYNVLHEMKSDLIFSNKIDKELFRFTSNLENSHYKKRTLLLIKKMYNNELSKHSISLIDNSIRYMPLDCVSNFSSLKK